MAEENQPEPVDNGEEQAGDGEQGFALHSLYLKDVSFEAPNAPAIFQTKGKPEVQMNLGIDTQKLDTQLYEVVVSITVTAKVESQTLYLVELQQAGIFTLQGFDNQQLNVMLGVYCPNVLFPYAREAVSSLVSKGGFASLLLEPVNFEALYQQHLAQQAEQTGSA